MCAGGPRFACGGGEGVAESSDCVVSVIQYSRRVNLTAPIPSMADKYFDRKEAEDLLPTLVPWLEEAKGEKETIESFENELAQVASRILVLGGTSPPIVELLRKKREHDEAAERIVEIINRIQETGVLVKDLELGLI